MEFEWDPRKARTNLKKHGIDFEDAIGIFEGAVLELQSDRNNEQRWTAIGEFHGIIVTVAYTMRGERCRIISARRANGNERKANREAYPGESEAGTD
jgi:uncharacterized DUF497 family protein